MTNHINRRRVLHRFGDWREDSHPRDESGKFTSGGRDTGLGSAMLRGKAKAGQEPQKSSIKEKIKGAAATAKEIAKHPLEKTTELATEKAIRIGKAVKEIAAKKVAKLENAGFSKTSARVIATAAAVLGGSPASITTAMTGAGMIGAWGATPGLGAVEGAIVPAVAVGVKKTAEGAKKLDERLATLMYDWKNIRHKRNQRKALKEERHAMVAYSDTDTEDDTGKIVAALKKAGIAKDDDKRTQQFVYAAAYARGQGESLDDALAFAVEHFDDDAFAEGDD